MSYQSIEQDAFPACAINPLELVREFALFRAWQGPALVKIFFYLGLVSSFIFYIGFVRA